MRKALLLYNPLSGPRRSHRVADVKAAGAVLRAGGVENRAAVTQGPGDASEQVKQAIALGYDTIIACGGDGTVHEALQGLVGTEVALAVIPLGTANALAHDLGVPLSPKAAARALLHGKARRVSAGRVEYQDFSGQASCRYFTVAAGIGVDAELFYKLNPAAKRHLGMLAYYFQGTRLWLTHKMEHFQVEMGEDGARQSAQVSQLLAVRIQDFGNLLRELAPGASLERDDLRLVLFRTRSRAAYLGYLMRGLVGARWRIPGIEWRHAWEVQCQPIDCSPGQSSRIFVEADGELLGTLPARVSIVRHAFTLLMP
ncbi:MAG TPA: diacylglycerol kinase family protein [Terriglobales bacterium]|nr:diacylglycerol kinase family protein [Terriglobales bacterium]